MAKIFSKIHPFVTLATHLHMFCDLIVVDQTPDCKPRYTIDIQNVQKMCMWFCSARSCVRYGIARTIFCVNMHIFVYFLVLFWLYHPMRLSARWASPLPWQLPEEYICYYVKTRQRERCVSFAGCTVHHSFTHPKPRQGKRNLRLTSRHSTSHKGDLLF